MCSRKWAVPLVASVSAREPASIQAPTVAVWAEGVDSVATVRPLGRVVILVKGVRTEGVARARAPMGTATRGTAGLSTAGATARLRSVRADMEKVVVVVDSVVGGAPGILTAGRRRLGLARLESAAADERTSGRRRVSGSAGSDTDAVPPIPASGKPVLASAAARRQSLQLISPASVSVSNQLLLKLQLQAQLHPAVPAGVAVAL